MFQKINIKKSFFDLILIKNIVLEPILFIEKKEKKGESHSMAKHNSVFLYALVAKNPKIYKNVNTGEYVTGYCPVIIIRGNRESGFDGVSDIRYDTPIIMTGNEAIIRQMEEWKENDIVEIKGVITTKNVTKKAVCPYCGNVKRIEGCTFTFITPIFTELRKTGISKEEGIQMLKEHIEISNQVSLLGYLVTEPDYYRTQYGVDITQYPIAVNRKYRIKDDEPSIKTDYPWIKSFNVIARKDAQLLKKSALVFIDGMIQTREITRKTFCDSCEDNFEFPDSAVEIVSYSTEYLNGCRTPEELEKMAEMKAKQVEDEIFSE